jgi:hypothetical protein
MEPSKLGSYEHFHKSLILFSSPGPFVRVPARLGLDSGQIINWRISMIRAFRGRRRQSRLNLELAKALLWLGCTALMPEGMESDAHLLFSSTLRRDFADCDYGSKNIAKVVCLEVYNDHPNKPSISSA